MRKLVGFSVRLGVSVEWLSGEQILIPLAAEVTAGGPFAPGPEGPQLPGGQFCVPGPQAAAHRSGTLPPESLGTDAEALGDSLPASLSDRHPGDLGRGEHQLGAPDVGAQEPGGDPGKVQPVCPQFDPDRREGVTGGGQFRETFRETK